MQNLHALLERFSKVLNKKSLAKEAVKSVIKERVGINISPDRIFIKDRALEIEASPAMKSEIMLKSEAILGELKEVYKLNFSRIFYK